MLYENSENILIFDNGYADGGEGTQIIFEENNGDCEIEINSREYGRYFPEESSLFYLNDDEMRQLRDWLDEALRRNECE